MFFGVNMFWALLSAHFSPSVARAKMSLSRAQNIFTPVNINYIVILKFDFAAELAFLPDVTSFFFGWSRYTKSAKRRRVFSPAPGCLWNRWQNQVIISTPFGILRSSFLQENSDHAYVLGQQLCGIFWWEERRTWRHHREISFKFYVLC